MINHLCSRPVLKLLGTKAQRVINRLSRSFTTLLWPESMEVSNTGKYEEVLKDSRRNN